MLSDPPASHPTSRTDGSVSMHLLVLSAFRLPKRSLCGRWSTRSQCTFWCSVLSDTRNDRSSFSKCCLNAPFGAQCFPTVPEIVPPAWADWVSMHLLVLSAFRQQSPKDVDCSIWSQCTFWCSVLSDWENQTYNAFVAQSQCTFWCSVLSDLISRTCRGRVGRPSQCTFWCSVLSDAPLRRTRAARSSVSMHLLVLSAFRRKKGPGATR